MADTTPHGGIMDRDESHIDFLTDARDAFAHVGPETAQAIDRIIGEQRTLAERQHLVDLWNDGAAMTDIPAPTRLARPDLSRRQDALRRLGCGELYLRADAAFWAERMGRDD